MAFGKKKTTETVDDVATLTAEDIKKPNDGLTKNLEFLSWIQEFSKKVVTLTFIIYIISEIFALIMIFLEYQVSYEVTYIDTFISEINETFRDVIGGYLIKAACENVLKIGGGYLESYMSSKTTVIEQTMVAKSNIGHAPMNRAEDEVVDDSEDPMAPEE